MASLAEPPADLSAALRTPLAGARVRVTPLARGDEADYLAAARDAELFAWFPVDMAGEEARRAEFAAMLADADAGRLVPFAVRDAATGELLGATCFLALAPGHRRVEIGGTWVVRSRWSTGVNVEVKRLLLAHAFERAGLRRVEFKTDARNARSRRALGALGARPEGIHRRHMVIADGSSRDSAYYAITDEDWPGVRASLDQRLEAMS